MIASLDRSERTLTVFNPEEGTGADESTDGSTLERPDIVDWITTRLEDRYG